MLKKLSNDKITDLCYATGRFHIADASRHPRTEEVDFVVFTFLDWLSSLSRLHLGNEDYLIDFQGSQRQIINNLMDYLHLSATPHGDTTYIITKLPAEPFANLEDDEVVES